MRNCLFGLALAMTAAGALQAQEVSVPSVTTASPGGYANPLQLDTDRYQREQRGNNRSERRAQTRECSADALPAADRQRMEAEYARRFRSDGKASADAWVREQGKQFHLRLVAEGVCLDPAAGNRSGTQTARNDRSESGEGCKMVMRPVAGLGGGPMTMGMVPDCGDDD
ncbi:hypothetical protein GRI97_06305 [Altererythrobacter xixiisoli]|uniref:Uncharacterized protein n=1 Tax=Croceibacterium xixiisoli TaxID=1476466 RepID=A0A6I4TVH9_9SPHN|nr:hypothetical protein [Croceibacterium xixiisoli]MXO98598.1 hypothetical protein [Croceibacterium xixiisoli]